jgi:pimeloyl-ACP methyl ester carboxylesterase
MRYKAMPGIAAGLVLAAACTDESPLGPPSYLRTSAAVVTSPTSGPWARIVEGETGPGSLYALYIPKDWETKGKGAIYFAHGIRPPLNDITLGDQDNFFEVRDSLGGRGYAFAYSSFSENGLAVKDGAQRTHQLKGLLAAELGGRPQKNYLVGYSLGALAAMQVAETFPTQYDGVLAMCGMVGGTPLELKYIADVRALFDVYYPGVLPGNAITPPAKPLSLDEVKARVIAAITPTAANPRAPFGLFAIASTRQTPLAYPPIGSLGDPTSLAFQGLVGSLINALYYQLIGTADVLDRTHGHSPYDNRNTVYTIGTPAVPVPELVPVIEAMIAGSNQAVARFDMPPDAQNYLEKYYVPTGKLQIPVVSVHNMWDPLVPFFHEAALADIMQAAGSSDKLVPRAVPNYGHCNFQTPLVLDSFETLVRRADVEG